MRISAHQDECLLRRWLGHNGGGIGYEGWQVGIENSKSTNARFAVIERRGMGAPIKMTFLYVQERTSRKRAFGELRKWWALK